MKDPKEIKITLDYLIGDYIYSSIMANKRGIILDWKVNGACRYIQYMVSWAEDGTTDWYLPSELSEDPTIEF